MEMYIILNSLYQLLCSKWPLLVSVSHLYVNHMCANTAYIAEILPHDSCRGDSVGDIMMHCCQYSLALIVIVFIAVICTRFIFQSMDGTDTK